ncbi:MAG: DUF4910 domain-containing protein [Candidatus Eisenbacteria bacterium]|uniref:DUF4910 domain-containing protein n=1 Tax=Eiseniibacteriota bacterium TaxID=2212470 RepID=A0A933SCL9_UNCEI|nr:DUF4910 domain-containing protein [Candidatus Eisenbacteria bacterium]
MSDPRLALVFPLVSGDRALRDVEQIARHHRIQSSPGYSDAAAWLVASLRAAGLEPEVVRVSGDGATALAGCVMPLGWDCERGSATLHGTDGPRAVASFADEPLSLVQRSVSAAGRWPVVALADGASASHYDGIDVRGKVVLTDGAVMRVHQLAVLERGAAGLLSDGRRLVPPARTRETDPDSLAYTSFWWGDAAPSGWGVVLSPGEGERLRGRLAAREAVELEVDIAAAFAPRDIELVSAVVPGPLPGEVLVTAHLCHPKPGANDNGSGVAAALECARVVAALAAGGRLPAERRTVRWLWMPEFTGTHAWIAARPEAAGATIAALNLDMVGEDQAQCASVQQLERAPHFASSFVEELLARLRQEGWGESVPFAHEEVRYGGGSDHAVWLDPARGVPCGMLIQWPDRYYHSNLDGPERCDPRSLAHAARIACAFALTVAAPAADDLRTLAAEIEARTRRRLRAALDSPQPLRAARAARLAGHTALASLDRLAIGLDAAHPVRAALRAAVLAAADGMEGHFDSEIAPTLPVEPVPAAARPGRVPVRLQRTPIVPMLTHQSGFSALPHDARERFVALEEQAGGYLAFEVAWFAANGERAIPEIAELVRDEGHEVGDEALEEWFALVAEMGAARWRE